MSGQDSEDGGGGERRLSVRGSTNLVCDMRDISFVSLCVTTLTMVRESFGKGVFLKKKVTARMHTPVSWLNDAAHMCTHTHTHTHTRGGRRSGWEENYKSSRSSDRSLH